MPSRRVLTVSLVCTALIVGAYMIGRQSIVMLITLFICGALLYFDINESASMLFFMSPMSFLLSYGGYNIYIILLATYFMKTLSKSRFFRSMVYIIVLTAFCLVFMSTSDTLRPGMFISPILVAMVISVLDNTDKDHYRELLESFTLGFIVSAIIGIAKTYIPSMQPLFAVDYLGNEAASYITRYSGLAYDPNFFAVMDCLVISVILFTNKKLTAWQIVSLIFLVIVGFFTFSKSYILMITAIALIYILKNSTHVLRNILLVGFVVLAFVVVEKMIKIPILTLVLERFAQADSADELTTGRLGIWAAYIEYIFGGVKQFLVGAGFNNTTTIHKAAHNTLIEFLYRFGLIGCTLWFVFFKDCFKSVSRDEDHKKIPRNSTIPMIVIVVGFLFLSAFHFTNFWICICVALLAMYVPKEEPQKCLR